MSEAEKRQLFGELVAEHHPRIRNYIRSMGVASSAVDDIAQDALVVAFKQFDTFEPGTSFPAWVNTIARNVFWGSSRKKTRRARILNETVTDLLVSSDPYQELANQDDSSWELSALQTCMERIPEDYREMVTQRYAEGVEANQLAENLGIVPSTLRQRLHRLRQALKDCITDILKSVDS